LFLSPSSVTSPPVNSGVRPPQAMVGSDPPSTEEAMADYPLSIPDELRKLGDLKASGVLTDDEFSTAKAAILRTLISSAPVATVGNDTGGPPADPFADTQARKASLEERWQGLIDGIEAGDCHAVKDQLRESKDLIVSVMQGVNSYSDFGDSGDGWYNSFMKLFEPIDDLESVLRTHGKDTSAADNMKEKVRIHILHWMRIGMKYYSGERKR
jgi:hypothetical protein